MLDIWLEDTLLTAWVLVLTAAVLGAQLWLCFRVKHLLPRLLPAIVLAAATAVLLVLSALSRDWDALGYIFLALFTGALLLMCGVAWAVWALSRGKGKRR